jgi:hypothetical protein
VSAGVARGGRSRRALVLIFATLGALGSLLALGVPVGPGEPLPVLRALHLLAAVAAVLLALTLHRRLPAARWVAPVWGGVMLGLLRAVDRLRAAGGGGASTTALAAAGAVVFLLAVAAWRAAVVQHHPPARR